MKKTPVKVDYNSSQFQGVQVSASWIQDLTSSNSRKHKEQVIQKALVAAQLGSVDAQCFLYNCFQAYNPFYVFNVKKVIETQGLTGQVNPWPKFWALCEDLRTRTQTGHNALDAIDEVSQQFDSDEWNLVCRRVLIKDLRAGISEKTLNKILKKTTWAIPVFSCQLAKDSKGNPSKMRGKKRIERKLDGVRVLAMVVGENVTLCSRNGKEFDTFPQVSRAISAIAKKLRKQFGGQNIVLDGEIMGDSFQKLMRQARRKKNVQTQDMIFNVFDVIPLVDFQTGICRTKQSQRLANLEAIRANLESQDCIRVMSGIDVDLNTSEGHDIMNRYAKDAVREGFEGIMIKDHDGVYQCKRSDSWLKWKPVTTFDLKIIGFEEGTNKNKGRLGAFICEGIEDGKLIRVNVGSGITDTERDEFWAERRHLMGRIVEILADAVTQDKEGNYSLRFPRFVRFRNFTRGEKI